MVKLLSIASTDGATNINVVFVHGLGGDPYSTWMSQGDDGFWPYWLAEDIAGSNIYTLSYEAPKTNWSGSSLSLEDRATTVMERLLATQGILDAPIIFICHSLGGLVVKQVLNLATEKQDARKDAKKLLSRVKGVIFIATPHFGSNIANWADKLRFLIWPSQSTTALMKNSSNLRHLNRWFRNWNKRPNTQIFFETVGTSAGTIVDAGSADAGITNVDPVPIERDHINICKPDSRDDLMYVMIKDFIISRILNGKISDAAKPIEKYPFIEIKRQIPFPFVPVFVRLVFLGILAVIFYFGITTIYDRYFKSGPTPAQIIQEAEGRAKTLKNELDELKSQIEDSVSDFDIVDLLQLGADEYAAGNIEKADGIFKSVEADSERFLRMAGAAAYSRGIGKETENAFSEASVHFEKAVRLQPDNWDYQFVAGENFLRIYDLEVAIEYYRSALELAENMDGEEGKVRKILSLDGLAYSQQRLGLTESAEKSYLKSLNIADSGVDMRVGCETGNRSNREAGLNEIDSEQMASTSVNLAQLYMDAQKYDEARNCIKYALSLNAGNADQNSDLVAGQRMTLGRISLQQGSLQSAILEFEQVNDLISPENELAFPNRTFLATALARLGQDNESRKSIEILDGLLKVAKDSFGERSEYEAELHILKGMNYLVLRELAEAETSLKNARSLNDQHGLASHHPDVARVEFGLAKLDQANSRFGDAMQRVEKALENLNNNKEQTWVVTDIRNRLTELKSELSENPN